MVLGLRFCHFSSIFRGLKLCLGIGESGPVTSQGYDKIWHCFEFQSTYLRVLLCEKSQTLHKMNNLFLNKATIMAPDQNILTREASTRTLIIAIFSTIFDSTLLHFKVLNIDTYLACCFE